MYPISIDIKNKKCVVVGGGKVAYRKASSLCLYGARVKVISPKISPEIRVLAQDHSIMLNEKDCAESDIQDAYLVFACTNSSEVNQQVSRDALRYNILINCTEDSSFSSFISPSSFSRGDLVVSVSTNGKYPMLAKQMIEELKSGYGEDYAFIVDELSNYRQKVLECVKVEDQKLLLKQAITKETIQIALEQGITAYRNHLEKTIERYFNE